MIRSKKHIAQLLKIKYKDLVALLDNTDNYYYEKKIEKKDENGKTKINEKGEIEYRVLYPSKDLLKDKQDLIKKRVLDNLELPKFVHGGVKGRSNISNAMIHKGNKYFFQTDIKKFFPSIRHYQVYDMFIRNEFSPDVAKILTRLTTHNGRLPQGTPTSPGLSNLVFCLVDKEIAEFCSLHNLTFTRFVDDIAISSKKCFREKSSSIIEIITEAGYTISRKKTYYKIGPTDITGVSVHNNFLTTTKEFSESFAKVLSLIHI